MAERAVVWVDGVQVPGRDMRLAQAALLTPTAALTARAGVLFGLEVTATSPATMAVSVAAGQCAVTVDETAPGGVALCANDAAVTVPIAAADATNPRIDLVVARVYGELTAVGSRRWALEVVQGTPAASPVAPALPANSLLLRAVTVAANASSIASGDISTTLPARTAAAGGITPSRDGVDVVGAVVGQYRDRLDTGSIERWDGAAWGAVGSVNAPRGIVARQIATGNSAAVTTLTLVYSQTFTAQAGRTHKVSIGGLVGADSAGVRMGFVVRIDGSDVLHASLIAGASGNSGEFVFGFALVSGLAAGSHTVEGFLNPFTAGAVTIIANAGYPSTMLVEDVGVA